MTASTMRGGPGTRRGPSFLDSWLFVRLILIGLAVLGTLSRFWPPVTLLWWLLAAAGVISALLRRPGRDAIDWIARGLGIAISALILFGVVLNAIAIPLESATWALTFAVVGAVIVIGSHLRAQRVALAQAQAGPHGHVGDGLDLGQRSVSDDVVAAWRAGIRRPGQAAWLLAAAAMVVGAVTIGVVTEPRREPELALSLSDPAVASTSATSVRVTIAAREPLDNLLLRVQNPDGTMGADQRFAVGAGQSVERVVALAATGDSQILLTSPGQPELARTLTVNR